MTELLTQNGKIAKSGAENGFHVVNFGIPAYRSQDGTITCPMAGSCGVDGGCYALQGSYTWTPVKAAYEYRLAVTRQDNFVAVMTAEIAKIRKRAAKKQLKVAVRVHDSGDFYSYQYMMSWFDIARANPDIQFYAYTKMVDLAHRIPRPLNFTLILSEGGLADSRIGADDRHSRVFSSMDDLVAAGYDNATEDDTVAFRSESGLIGLVYHGYKSKEWTTSDESRTTDNGKNKNAA
jgi:hypothetical protein